jgi:hypothetical protein
MADVSDGEADPAQEAAESNRWSDVHRILADADAARKLSPAELELYATAGYLLGLTSTPATRPKPSVRASGSSSCSSAEAAWPRRRAGLRDSAIS